MGWLVWGLGQESCRVNTMNVAFLCGPQNSWDLAVLNVFSPTDFQVTESSPGELLQELPFFFSQDF